MVSPDLSWLQFSVIPRENFSAANIAVLCYMRAEKLLFGGKMNLHISVSISHLPSKLA